MKLITVEIFIDNEIKGEHISECDTVLIADIEHNRTTSNLLNLSR